MRYFIQFLFLISMIGTLPLYGQEPEPDRNPNPELQAVAAEFFEWRLSQQPVAMNIFQRLERPSGWVPDASPEALLSARLQYRRFKSLAQQLDKANWSIADQVDGRLLLSAIERIHWELEILKSPYRNPRFYVDQTLGSLFEVLVISSEITEERVNNLLIRMEHIPLILQYARQNLVQPVQPFAVSALDQLENVEQRLQQVSEALEAVIPAEFHERLKLATNNAILALQEYAEWLTTRLNDMQTAFSIGPVAMQWFLSHVALIPHSTGDLLRQGEQAWQRAEFLSLAGQHRNRDLSDPPLPENTERQIKVTELKAEEIRNFIASSELMTVPDDLQQYLLRPMPDTLEPLSSLGVTADLTSAIRLDENAWRYISQPSPDLDYFLLSAAQDPRILIIHEGIPGHYFQLFRSWNNPRPIRRHFYDFSANEGLTAYLEELMLQSGPFDFSPKSREMVNRRMKLRSLSVEADIRLAMGDLTINQAVDWLVGSVPMDRSAAETHVMMMAANPGQALSRQAGKLQILNFLSDARQADREGFSLKAFHDLLVQNANVLITLQRWEYLGNDDQILRLGVLRGEPATVPQ